MTSLSHRQWIQLCGTVQVERWSKHYVHVRRNKICQMHILLGLQCNPHAIPHADIECAWRSYWPCMTLHEAAADSSKEPSHHFPFSFLWSRNANFSERFHTATDLKTSNRSGLLVLFYAIPFLLADKTSSTTWRRLQKKTSLKKKTKKKHVKTPKVRYNRFLDFSTMW